MDGGSPIKPTLRNILLVFVWSLFMGLTAIAIGTGAAYPPLNYIAGPVVCPHGQMTVESTVYRPYPGRTITTRDWFCTDSSTGARQSLNFFEIDLVSGLVYGLVLFVVIVVFMWLLPRARAALRGEASAERQAQTDPVSGAFEELRNPYVRRATGIDDGQLVQLEETVRKARSGDGSPSGSSARRLKELENLRASNLITQAEYEAKRAEILKSL